MMTISYAPLPTVLIEGDYGVLDLVASGGSSGVFGLCFVSEHENILGSVMGHFNLQIWQAKRQVFG